SAFAWGPLGDPGYLLEFVYGPTRFRRLALARLDAGWRWVGVLHESLVRDDAYEANLLGGVRIRVHSDGSRSGLPIAEKFARDVEVLRRALADEPDNARYAFYFAQSLRDAGRLPEAIAAYEGRVAMGGWTDEVYYSRLQIALLKERCRAPYADVLSAWV